MFSRKLEVDNIFVIAGSTLTPNQNSDGVTITNLPTELIYEVAALLPLSSRRALAVSSRVLLDPSLKALWRSLPDLILVFQLFGELKYKARLGHWTLPGEINKNDLARFRYYSRFIRKSLSPFPPISSALLQQLSDAHATLFPALLECHLDENFGAHTPGHEGILLLSNSLEKLSVFIVTPGCLRGTAFPTSLRSLILSGMVSASDLESLIWCSNLQELSILPDNETQAAVDRVLSIACSLPRLRKLALNVGGIIQTDHHITTVLSLTLCGQPNQLAPIIACFYGLREITLDIRQSTDLKETDCISCFTSLASSSPGSLTSVKFRSNWSRYRQPFPLGKCLQGLKPLQCLRSLGISLPHRPLLALHDAMIIAQSWPQLEEVHTSACLTDRGLRLMASIPRLKQLSVGLGSSGLLQLPFTRQFDICPPSEIQYATQLFSCKAHRVHSNLTVSKRQLCPTLLQRVVSFANPSDLWTLLSVSRDLNLLSRERLWKNLPSLIPLLKLLPGILFSEGRVFYWNHNLLTLSELTFRIFDSYASLVETVVDDIFSCPLDRYQIHESVFESLHALHHMRNPLPNLRFVKYFRPRLRLGSLIPFISPRLESFSLDVRHDCTKNILGEILRLCPTITDIRLSGLLTADLLTALGGFLNLSTLSLNFLRHYYDQNPPIQYSGLGPQISFDAFSAAIDALGGICTLKTLAYNVPYNHRPFPPPPHQFFRSVVNLRLEGHPQVVRRHLSAFSNLEAVSLHFDPYDLSDEDMGDALEKCCGQLETNSGHCLKLVSISCRSLLNIFEYIQPLWKISGIRAFGMRLETNNSHTPEPQLRRCDSLHIARHWPLLESLIFNGRYGGNGSSLHDLLPLTPLKKLERLQVPGVMYPLHPPDLDFKLGHCIEDLLDTVLTGRPLFPTDRHDSLKCHDILARQYVNPMITDF